MPNFETHAPQGYMGDWRRGAPLGRGYIGPDRRTLAELEADFAAACQWLSDALRLKENRPGDGYKARCWEAAAQAAREEKERLRDLIKAAQARPDLAPKITLQRVRLDSGGYDPQGAYWGLGAPLYWAASDDVELDWTFRADSRDHAKAQVRESYPGARFHN
jgi:hypothetical protein